MRAFLIRDKATDTEVTGRLIFQGLPFVFPVLENPWLDNRRNVSCIPSGRYGVTPWRWGEENKNHKYYKTYCLIAVPSRSGILIHIGNTAEDTRGCILPGSTTGVLQGRKAVLSSRVAMERIREYVGQRDFEIIVDGVVG